jgi:TPR repeat protein
MPAKKRGPFDAAWHVFDTAAKDGYPHGFLRPLETRAARGDLGSLNVLYTVYQDGVRAENGRWIVRKSVRTARRYQTLSAALGEPEAMTSVADRLKKNPATRKRALRLYKLAFNKGYDTAAYNLALTYKRAQQYGLSVAWLKKAARCGDETALFDVAVAELYGVGTRRDPESAFFKLKRVARSRAVFIPHKWLQIQAMLTMSRALDEGWVVPINKTAAMKWLRLAASLGSAIAKAEMLGH